MSQGPGDEFSVLLARVRAGESGAFEELTAKYGPALQRTARALLGRALRAQFDTVDLVQTVHHTVLTVIRNGSFAVGDSEQLCALALTILRRKIARRWRDVKREPGAAGAPQDRHDPQDAPDPADPNPDPADAALFKDELETLLGEADEIDRRALELRLAGYNTADAARELGLDPAALRMRLGRLRKRLRDATDDDPPPADECQSD